MAWQDFCHFPSYEIPACLYRLREHLEFVEAVVPGTTLVFRVKSQWKHQQVSMAALDLGSWTFDEVMDAWKYWMPFVAPEKAALFSCGMALMLCDIGLPNEALLSLMAVHTTSADAIVKKWKYLKSKRPDLVVRYHPLFAYLESQGAI
jgi:hypothetical protein